MIVLLALLLPYLSGDEQLFRLSVLIKHKSFFDIYKRLKADFFLKDKVVVMLDNFTPTDVKQVAPRLRRSGLFVEVSGGVTETNITGYNVSGVSAISVGAIR